VFCMSDNKMMYAAAAISLALAFALTAYGAAGFPGMDGEDNGIEIVGLEQDVKLDLEENGALLVDREGDEVVLAGQITGNTAGQTVFVDSVEKSDGVVNINIGLEEADGPAAMVITDYTYELTLSNVPSDADIVVFHGDEKHELTGNGEIKEL